MEEQVRRETRGRECAAAAPAAAVAAAAAGARVPLTDAHALRLSSHVSHNSSRPRSASPLCPPLSFI